MIGWINAQAHAGNLGGGGRVGLLQPRGRAAGDGRQAHASHRAPASRACPQSTAPRALACGNGALDARLAAAGGGAAAGVAGGRAADDGRGLARAAVLRGADARGACRASRAPCDARDRGWRRGHCRVRSQPQHRAQGLPRSHARARGTRVAHVAPVHSQPRAPAGRLVDDDRGRTGVRLERRGHQAVLRRSFTGTPVVRARLGTLHGRRLRGGGTQ
jgi:hypothetical protein